MQPLLNFLIFFLLFAYTAISHAQVVINEYSASNLYAYKDNYQKTEDWIELYNLSNQPIDISGFYLSDRVNKPMKWRIPDGTILNANGFLTVWCSDRDEITEGQYHTNFKLSQTTGNDNVVLSDASGAVIDIADEIVTLVEHSVCRSEDGTGIWQICMTSTFNASNEPVEKFKSYTQPPFMDLEAGFHEGTQFVRIFSAEPNSIIRYTVDGSTPDENSLQYADTLFISKTTILKARVFSNDSSVLPGKVTFNTYFIDEAFTLPVYSIASTDIIELANGDGDLIPVGSLEYFDGTQERVAISYGDLNRHGQDSWQLDHRSLDWVSRDEMGYSKEIKAHLFSHSDRDAFQRIIFRNSGDDNYPAIDAPSHNGSAHIRDEYVHALALEGGMQVDVRAVQRAILFLNGAYWGLYGVREKPVDHDYTKEYYDQDKYNLHYLSTWGRTQARYGRRDAFNDWYQLRDFILDNDMSDSANYKKVTDQLDVLSLIDYMIANLNSVAKDWLNYNTGWWRGLNPEGDHKKWGYILWDLDATFGYYINYTGVPNVNPDATPCDLDDISESMDEFWGNLTDYFDCHTIKDSTSIYEPYDPVFQAVVNTIPECCSEGWESECESLYTQLKNEILIDPKDCPSIASGSSPYPAEDTIFQQVVAVQPACCEFAWFENCQNTYDQLEAGYDPFNNAFTRIRGNVGKHEKIFLKLLEESQDFKQLYYSRQSDLKNTVYSCANMMETLDRMLAEIKPEMPRQIERWGGSMEEWEENVNELKDFVELRCTLLDTGMINCYNVTGPFALTLTTSPENIGEIKLNTLWHTSLPWTGTYFGQMEHLIQAKSINEEYYFSHWESASGHTIFPNATNPEAYLSIYQADTLIAVFESTVSTQEVNNWIAFNLFPNPTQNEVTLEYELAKSTNLSISISNTFGEQLKEIEALVRKAPGIYYNKVNLENLGIPTGIYFIHLIVEDSKMTRKVVFTH